MPEIDADDVLAEIARVLRADLGLSGSVAPGHELLADLQLDSLGLITLLVSLEDRYRVALSEEEAVGVRTAGDLASLVARLARRTR